jgi:hypothetical protein
LSLAVDTDVVDQSADLDSSATDHAGNLGPAMLALTPRQRAFVLALYELPPTRGALTKAAVRAGYGRNSNTKTLAQIAHKLWTHEKIRRAFQETGYRFIGHTAVAAIQAARELIFQPTHPDHLKACRLFIDRGWPIENLSKQQIDITHTHTDAPPDIRLLRRFAENLGVPLERLVGASRPPEDMDKLFGADWREPKLIEATPVVINEGDTDGTK